MASRRLQLLKIRNPICQACSLRNPNGNTCVMGRGNPYGKIMLIGEAPGEAEARTGKPFMGRSGQLLNEILVELQLTDSVYITNVCKCRPPGNRKPNFLETSVCTLLFLQREIDLIQPEVLVLLGRTAIDVVFQKESFVRHKLQVARGWSCTVIPTWHPSYCLRVHKRYDSITRKVVYTRDELKGAIQCAAVRSVTA